MNLDDLKEYLSKLPKIDFTQKEKIYATISLGWIIFIGYLTWWNGLKGFERIKVSNGMNGFGLVWYQL